MNVPSLTVRGFCAAAALALAGTVPIASNASPASAHAGPMRVTAAQRERLLAAKPVRIASWISPSIKNANAKTPLLYASFLTSVSTGQTNIYQQQGSTLALVGQLSQGGGPVATDASGNVYVAEAGSNALGYVPRNIYVYAPGSTKPARILKNPDYMAWAIAVAKNGTVYVAGPAVTVNAEGQNVAAVVKFAPGKTKGTVLPADPILPWTAASLAVDSSGDLFAGWVDAYGNTPQHCSLGGLIGCVRELKAGSTAWQAAIPFGAAANGITTGPVLGPNNSLVLTTIASAQYVEFMMTFQNGSKTPSQVTPLPYATLPVYDMTMDGSGTALWVGNTLFNSAVAYTIWQIDYPTGKIRVTYPVPTSSVLVPTDNGLAVSPAYYPN